MFYKQFVYNAKDGWIAFSANTFRFGGRLGILIAQRVELLIRGGYEIPDTHDAFIPNFYAIFSANMRL